MQLDNRKWTILNAIIKTYLETGEPVGSRTISKFADLGLSSATIRNEMSDLEDMGYILQPHTSAGRIPSDMGYRVYVSRMMEDKDREVTQMKEMMIEKQDKVDQILKRLANVLAVNTNYATMVSSPQYKRTKMKFIQLSVVNPSQLLAVIVVEGNVVRNKMINLEHGLDQESILKLNILLNSCLNGLTIEEINLSMISRLKEQAGIHSEIVSRVLDMVAEAIQSEEEMEIYTSGATNFFRYPELADSEKASELIHAFEDKRPLASLFEEDNEADADAGGSDSHGIQVYIGKESSLQTMRDCSLVTATYDLGGGMQGRIGIVGPKRMDYEKVVSTLRTLMVQLDEIYHREE